MEGNDHHHFKVDLDDFNFKKSLKDELCNILTEHDVTCLSLEDIFYYGYCFAFEHFRNSLEISYKNGRSFQESLLDLEEAFEFFKKN